MKRISFALAAAAVVVSLAGINCGALAQTGPGAGAGMGAGSGAGAGMGAKRGAGKMQKMDPERMLKRMEANLGLSAEQKEKIRPILQEEIEEMKAIRNDTTLTRTQKREKMQEMRDRYHAKIGEQLTPEQRQKADAMREKAKERWEKRKGLMKERQKPTGEVK